MKGKKMTIDEIFNRLDALGNGKGKPYISINITKMPHSNRAHKYFYMNIYDAPRITNFDFDTPEDALKHYEILFRKYHDYRHHATDTGLYTMQAHEKSTAYGHKSMCS